MLRLLFPLLIALFALPWVALGQPETTATDQSTPLRALGADTLPPLSLGDAVNLTHRSQLLLEGHGGTGVAAEDQPLARLMLQCVIDFVRLQSHLHRSLTTYHWAFLGKEVIEAQDVDQEITLIAVEPISRVQALAFETTRERVLVKSATVETAEGRSIELRRIERLLDPEIPGRSYHYLPDHVTVTRVTVTATATTWGQGRPRLKVYLGQSPRPEHLHQALAHLEAARDALDGGNIDLAKAELDLSRARLTSALEAEAE
jgi:hypothetical protein